MKNPLLIILFLLLFHLPERANSQKITKDGVVILHDSLIKGRFGELDLISLKGWKFKPVDNHSYSSSNYDDSFWETIYKPLNEVEDLPNSWNGFGWFRLKVKIDSSFSMQNSLISANNSGGLEFYINDSLVLKQGNPSQLESGEVLFGSTIDPGKIFTWERGKTYQLAIKYSLHDFKSLQGLVNRNSPLQFSLAVFNLRNLKILVLQSQRFAIVFASSSILLFLVMILHFTLYRRNKDEIGNFWVFLLSFTIFISTSLTVLRNNYDFPNFFISEFMSLTVSIGIFSSIGLIPLVAHKVLKVRYNHFWKYFSWFPIIILILIVFAPEIWIDDSLGFLIMSCALFLSILGGGIAVFKAKKQKNKDVYLIAVPILSFPILFVFGNVLFDALEVESVPLELIVIFLLVTIIPLGFSIYQAKRFFRMHKHLDQMVDERTLELEQAMDHLRQSHQNLKEAQDQLVQQEKLASLGQLTAGIAHEIKNPLNFVTNFSDVCLELIEEAKMEIGKQKKMFVKVQPEDNGESRFLKNLDDLLETVELNLKKIFQHGTRADGIVKSMLLHSRGGSGKREPTDLNHLVKEYVNLAYHGMRASRNPIDVEIRFNLYGEIKKVPLIAEDFSRVILNFCNNAFDAMRERTTEKDYQPVLLVSTQKDNGLVKVSVEDNGPGISPDILNSVLQPFFTTKKGTEGTGLGLSLSNEIVKAHGGEINIESELGTGAIFIIILPLKNVKDLNNIDLKTSDNAQSTT